MGADMEQVRIRIRIRIFIFLYPWYNNIISISLLILIVPGWDWDIKTYISYNTDRRNGDVRDAVQYAGGDKGWPPIKTGWSCIQSGASISNVVEIGPTRQGLGSMTFWSDPDPHRCRSNTGSDSFHQWLYGCKKNNFFIFFSCNSPRANYVQS